MTPQPRFRLLKLLFASTRPLSSCVAGLLAFAAVWLKADFSRSAVLAGIAMGLVTMFGFVLNDILDYSKDKGAGVQRPIALGQLSRRTALLFSILLVATACFCALLIRGAPVLLLTAIALVLYTPLARRIPKLKGAYVAALSLLPLLYGATITHCNISGAAYAMDALFVFGREVLMDADELAGDQLAGMHTVAASLGSSSARRLGMILMLGSLFGLNFVSKGMIGSLAAAVSLASLVCILAWHGVTESRRISFTRVSMLAGAVALASS